ncbi:MAG: SAM-dependent methyltransferase [Streptosporangiaceae bacterium]
MSSRAGVGPAAAGLSPDQPTGEVPRPADLPGQESLAAGIPNIARIYDALLGGKDNYATDREAALALTTAIPDAARAASDNRAFLRRAVRYLAAEAGIAQFLDVGTGLPTQGNVHEIAQEANPDARVVYVDNDPLVVAYGQALLAKTPGALVVEGDARYPRELITRREVREVLDFTQPVAVLLVAVLHFVGDSESPWQAVRAITSRIAPGSYLVISHVTGDQISAEAVSKARDIYAGAYVQGTARSRSEIARFFDGLDLIPPGLADVAAWGSGRRAGAARPALFWAGIGRKPGTGDGFR